MPDFAFEKKYGPLVGGIDEAGRGPLAGPVVAAMVMIDPQDWDNPVWHDVDDSKKLRPDKRRDLFEQITANRAVRYAVATVDPKEIDDINILQATLKAMSKAYHAVVPPERASAVHVLVDGNRAPSLPSPVTTIIKGDSQSVSIAAASIIAKVTRDRIMMGLDHDYPFYGWGRNAGYGTKSHRLAIQSHGLSPHHRRSFCRSALGT